MELVDLYDENRIPLGRTAERHDQLPSGAYRTVVHVCIFNRRGELLCQQRSKDKLVWPNRWDVSAAGGVDTGETSRDAAERETREELGYALILGDQRAHFTINFPLGFDDFFIAEREIDLKTLTLQKEEVQAVAWMSREEVLARLDSGSFATYPKAFLEYLFETRSRFGF